MTPTVRSDRHASPDTSGARRTALPETAVFPFLRPPGEPGELGRLGNYRVFRLIGSGGMGKVFLAEDMGLKRDVALKVMCLPPGEDLVRWWERFLREARALAAIKHPNLVSVYQTGEDRGTVFLALELLKGETLESRLRRAGPVSAPEILRLAAEIGAGLSAIHERGLIHRDIKPSNIWLENTDNSEAISGNDETKIGGSSCSVSSHPTVKILDFGLVREIHEDTHLTEAGTVVGTPAYMSPEQARNLALDHRTDLFSFGCVLYAMATGRAPFAASNAIAQTAALVADDPVGVRQLNPDIPEPLARLIARLLAKNPNDRPASAAVVVQRLRAIRDGFDGTSDTEVMELARRPFFRRRAVGLSAVVCACLVLAALVAVARTREPNHPGPQDTSEPQPQEAAIQYLSELPKRDEHRFPPPGFPPPPGVDGSVWVGGVRSPHGIFMHGTPPFGPPAHISYALDKNYARFRAEVAQNDTAKKWGAPVIFTVSADGKEIWCSRTVDAGAPKESCDLDVRGVTVLTIGLRTMGVHHGAHGAWIEPHLTK